MSQRYAGSCTCCTRPNAFPAGCLLKSLPIRIHKEVFSMVHSANCFYLMIYSKLHTYFIQARGYYAPLDLPSGLGISKSSSDIKVVISKSFSGTTCAGIAQNSPVDPKSLLEFIKILYICKNYNKVAKFSCCSVWKLQF